MNLYFKSHKVFLGIPVGWPLLACLSAIGLLSIPLWLAGHRGLAWVMLYPLAAVLVAMLADHEKSLERAKGRTPT
ncbi:MAG: hypothetical protein EKK47_13585 [Burkholderiales bacterium]|nr:MAG: hypothetical protein EKK47_13585 [Burkholderiales bacterium]